MSNISDYKTKREWALWCARRGWRVFPVKPNAKTPLIKDWPARATTDSEQIEIWWTGWPEANIGIACGQRLFVADLDVKDGKDGISTANLLYDLDATRTFTVRTPTGGEHRFFRGPDVPNSAGRVAPGIDIRSARGFVVGPGSTIDGKAYRITDAAEVAEVPSALLADANSTAHRPERVCAAPTVAWRDDPIPEDEIERLREQIGPGHWHDPVRQAVARWVAQGYDDGAIWETAADLTLDGYSVQATEADLEQMAAGARAKGFGVAPTPEEMFSGVVIEPEPPKPSRLSFMGDEADTLGRWLMKGLLPLVCVVLLAGQSRVGKSFLALDLAGACATGCAFFGRRPRERVGVLYIAAEASGTVAVRMEALRLARLGGVESETVPICWADCQDPAQLDGVIAEAKAAVEARFGLRLGMVIVDTLAAFHGVADENDAALATRAMKALDRASRRHGVVVIGVAHAGKVAANGVRGSSAWTASADVILTATADISEATGNVTNRALALTKSRYGETGPISGFQLHSVRVGTDEDGDPVESAVVEPCARTGRPRKASKHTALLLEAFEEAQREAKGAEVFFARVRDLFRAKYVEAHGRPNGSGTIPNAFKAAMKGAGLVERGVGAAAILIEGPADPFDGIKIPDPGEGCSTAFTLSPSRVGESAKAPMGPLSESLAKAG